MALPSRSRFIICNILPSPFWRRLGEVKTRAATEMNRFAERSHHEVVRRRHNNWKKIRPQLQRNKCSGSLLPSFGKQRRWQSEAHWIKSTSWMCEAFFHQKMVFGTHSTLRVAPLFTIQIHHKIDVLDEERYRMHCKKRNCTTNSLWPADRHKRQAENEQEE